MVKERRNSPITPQVNPLSLARDPPAHNRAVAGSSPAGSTRVLDSVVILRSRETPAAFAGHLSGSSNPRKSVGAPFVAADAMMGKEQAVRIVALLDRSQAIEVRAPIGLLPVGLEEVRLRQIGTRSRRDLQEFIDGLANGAGSGARGGQVR